MAIEVDLMRHEISTGNQEKRYQGKLNFPLSEEGQIRAKLIAEEMKKVNKRYSAIYSSTLERAKSTAEPIAAAYGLRIREEPSFDELHLGDEVSGMKIEDIFRRFPDGWMSWIKNVAKPSPHFSGGEIVPLEANHTLRRLICIVSFWEDGDRILVISHEGKIRLILLKILNRLQDYHLLVPPQNGEIITLSFTEKLPHPVYKQKIYEIALKSKIRFLKLR